MNNKTLISIYGPTAVGKTNFALKLAYQVLGQKNERLGGINFKGVDIISADSRQIYRGLEVLTGADIPEGFEQKNQYFEKDKVRIHGVSIIELHEEWSVAHFKNFAIKIPIDSPVIY